jgi:hypothetical protein
MCEAEDRSDRCCVLYEGMSVLGVMGEKDPGSREGCSNAVIENQV